MSDYLCNSRVCCRVRVTRRVEFTRRVRVWNYFPTRVHLRVTRRVKFSPNGYGYGWALPIGYVPVAISTLYPFFWEVLLPQYLQGPLIWLSSSLVESPRSIGRLLPPPPPGTLAELRPGLPYPPLLSRSAPIFIPQNPLLLMWTQVRN
jgi:hypothetical protein